MSAGSAGNAAGEGAALGEAHRTTRALTHRAGANFSVGFRFLPRERRRAVYAAYAMCRLADDAVDEGDPAGAEERLLAVREELDAAYEGAARTASGLALASVLPRFPIPKAAFEGLMRGCQQDLVKTRYATFDELLGYCDLVASTISTISLAIFGGADDPVAVARGRDLATALQLTNVVRDVGEDAARGRIYLPLSDLARFGVSEDEVLARRATPALSSLLRFEAERALDAFRRAEPVKDLVDPECRFAVTMMGGIYAEVARRVLRDPSAPLVRRVGLTATEKAAAVLSRLFRRRFDRGV